MSITKVAKAAGVSTATVSRVLNDFPGVKLETARRVREAARELNYAIRTRQPASPTSALPGRRTGNIAAITIGQSRDWLQMPVMANALSGIRAAVRDLSYRLILDEIPDLNGLGTLVRRQEVDGVIAFFTSFVPPSEVDRVFGAFSSRLPVVWAMGVEASAPCVDHVFSDHNRIGYLAHEYLRTQSCQEVAFITLDPDWTMMRMRGQAFLNAAYDTRHPASAYLCTADPMVSDAYGKRVTACPDVEELIARLASATPRPTGLFIANDRTSVQLYPLLARHGLRPGQNLTVISCDNEDIRLSALHPRPVSIDVRSDLIGYSAVQRLMFRISHPEDPPIAIEIAPRLPAQTC